MDVIRGGSAADTCLPQLAVRSRPGGLLRRSSRSRAGSQITRSRKRPVPTTGAAVAVPNDRIVRNDARPGTPPNTRQITGAERDSVGHVS